MQSAVYENGYPVTSEHVTMPLPFGSNITLRNLPQATQDIRPDAWASVSIPQELPIRPPTTLPQAFQDTSSSQTMPQSIQSTRPNMGPSMPMPQGAQTMRPSLPMSQIAQGMRPSQIMPQTIQGIPQAAQTIRSSLPMSQAAQGMTPSLTIPQTVQGMRPNVGPSLPIPQAAQNITSSLPMPQTAQGMRPSQAMPQTVQGMRHNMWPSSLIPQAAQNAMMPHAQSVGPTMPQAAQEMRPSLTAPQTLHKLPQNIDPGAILQQEVNLSDGQLEALKKFLTNLDTSVGPQQAAARPLGQQVSLESQLGSVTADKLELLRSLLNGQGSRTAYQGQPAPVTTGNVSNGMLGQQVLQQADLPISGRLDVGGVHSAVPAYGDSYESPLNYVVRNTRELRIDSNTFSATPYSNAQQNSEGLCDYNQHYQVPPHASNSHTMAQQRVDHYPSPSLTEGTNHPRSQNVAGTLPLNVANYADSKPMGVPSACVTNEPSLGTLQMQSNPIQSVAQLPVDNHIPGFGYQPVVTTSNSCEYTFANGAGSLNTSSGFNTPPDMIDLHSTKDLYVAPQSMQKAMLMQQQHQTPNSNADASLPMLQNSTPVDQFMSSVGQMQSEVPETLLEDIDIPSLPVLEEILTGQNSDNLLPHGQGSNPQEFHFGQYAPSGYTQYNGNRPSVNTVNNANIAGQIGNSYNRC